MGDQREEKRQGNGLFLTGKKQAGQRLFSDAVRQNVEHTEPYILPANCPALYSSSEAVQAFDAIFCQRKRFI